MYAMNSNQQVAEERYQDLLREAEVERLARCIHQAPAKPFFYRLGQQLVVWGLRLQGAGSTITKTGHTI